jgi:hypothetical protein
MSPLIPRGFAELFYGPRLVEFYDNKLPLDGNLVCLPVFCDNIADDRTDQAALAQLTEARQQLRVSGRNGAVKLRSV